MWSVQVHFDELATCIQIFNKKLPVTSAKGSFFIEIIPVEYYKFLSFNIDKYLPRNTKDVNKI